MTRISTSCLNWSTGNFCVKCPEHVTCKRCKAVVKLQEHPSNGGQNALVCISLVFLRVLESRKSDSDGFWTNFSDRNELELEAWTFWLKKKNSVRKLKNTRNSVKNYLLSFRNKMSELWSCLRWQCNADTLYANNKKIQKDHEGFELGWNLIVWFCHRWWSATILLTEKDRKEMVFSPSRVFSSLNDWWPATNINRQTKEE